MQTKNKIKSMKDIRRLSKMYTVSDAARMLNIEPSFMHDLVVKMHIPRPTRPSILSTVKKFYNSTDIEKIKKMLNLDK